MLKMGGMALIGLAAVLNSSAQDVATPPPPSPSADQVSPAPPTPPVMAPDRSEIIIRPKGDKEGKVTIEIKNGEFLVNGEPVDKFEDPNVEIELRDEGDGAVSIYHSPFRGNYWDQERFNRDFQRKMADVQMRVKRMQFDANAAFLGVSSKKTESGGATILEVTKSSPAEKAGLKKGDVITKINDQKIESPDNLYETIHQFKPGDKVKVSFKRDGKDQTVTATLEKSENEPFVYKYNYRVAPIPPMADAFVWGPPAPRLGIKAQDSEDGKGVNVLEVTPGSSAEKAGLKKGDVITGLDGNTVNSTNELVDGVRDARDKASIKMKVLRNGKSQDLDIKIPRKLRTAEL